MCEKKGKRYVEIMIMRERVGEREQMLKQSGRRPKDNSGKTALALGSVFGHFDTELKCCGDRHPFLRLFMEAY